MSDDGNQAGDHLPGRQYYVNTGHVRQRQALYFNDGSQVDSLYGINVAKFDPQANADEKNHNITVPALICCGPDDKQISGLPLCKPDCLPARPPSSPGSPLSNIYMGIKCSNNPLSNATRTNNNTISYSSKPFRRRITPSSSPSRPTNTPGQIKSAIKTDSLAVPSKKSVRQGDTSPNATWTRSFSTADTSKNRSFTPDNTDPDSISNDPSTRMTTTEPTRTGASHTSVNRSSSEISTAVAKTVSFPRVSFPREPNTPSTEPATSPGGTDTDPDSSENYQWEQESALVSHVKTGVKWLLVMETYLLVWLLMLLYMCMSCSAHTSVVMANVLMVVVFWCEYNGYHCLVDKHNQDC